MNKLFLFLIIYTIYEKKNWKNKHGSFLILKKGKIKRKKVMRFLNLIFSLHCIIFRSRFRVSYLIWHEEIYRFIGEVVHFRHLSKNGWWQFTMYLNTITADVSSTCDKSVGSATKHQLEIIDWRASTWRFIADKSFFASNVQTDQMSRELKWSQFQNYT